MKLSEIVLESDYWTRFKPEAEKLENELKDTFDRDDINVSIIQHSSGDYAMGNVTIRVRRNLPEDEYQKMEDFISSKGFKITDGMNMADDDGDRYYYPNIKFEFEL